jgi:hypothetical protein
VPDYQLPDAAWPLQIRSADPAMFTRKGGRAPNPFGTASLYRWDLPLRTSYSAITRAGAPIDTIGTYGPPEWHAAQPAEPVIVTRWADGEIPSAPVAPVPATPADERRVEIERLTADRGRWREAVHRLYHQAKLAGDPSALSPPVPKPDEAVSLLRQVYWQSPETAEWLDLNDAIAAFLRDNGGIPTPDHRGEPSDWTAVNGFCSRCGVHLVSPEDGCQACGGVPAPPAAPPRDEPSGLQTRQPRCPGCPACEFEYPAPARPSVDETAEQGKQA